MNNELVRVLKEIIRQFGQDTLYDGKRTVGLFADLAPECSRELNMLTCLIKCDGHKLLLDVRTSASGAQSITRQKIIAKMTQEFFIDAAIAGTICDSFWAAIGGNPIPHSETVSKQTHQKSNVTDPPQPQNVAHKSADAAQNNATQKSVPNNRKRIPPVAIAAIALATALAVFAVVFFVTSPQREMEKESMELLRQAEQLTLDGQYDAALNSLAKIDTSWDGYEEVEAARLDISRKKLKVKLAEYEANGDNWAIISTVNENATPVDTEIEAVYQRAIQNYKADAISAAEAFAAAGDYASARSELTVAENHIGEDAEFSRKRAEIDEKEVLAIVLSYEAEGNYADAISYLSQNHSIVSGSAELQVKQSAYTEKYRTDVINKAANEYKANGYEAALSVLEVALKVLREDAELLNEVSVYEALAPVALVDTVCIYNTTKKQTGLTLKDKLGNTYYDAIQYRGGAYDISDDAYSRRDIYVLGKEYTRFTATVFVPKDRSSFWDNEISSSDKQRGAFTLCIYGDNKLLYQSPLMISTQYPIEIEIDVSGIEQLSFSWNTFADVSSEIGVSNAYLYKD